MGLVIGSRSELSRLSRPTMKKGPWGKGADISMKSRRKQWLYDLVYNFPILVGGLNPSEQKYVPNHQPVITCFLLYVDSYINKDPTNFKRALLSPHVDEATKQLWRSQHVLILVGPCLHQLSYKL